MAGALKTLVTMLQASTFLTASSVSVVFGEEEVNDQSKALPMVAVVPKGGPIVDSGYAQGTDPSVEMVWATKEQIELYLWAYSTASNATAIDHADAVEALRLLVLSAMQDQRYNQDGNDGGGLAYEAKGGRWELMQGAFNRYGRAYVMTVEVEIPIPMTQAVNATITSLTLTQTI